MNWLYRHFFKRLLDIFCSFIAIIVLLPLLLILTILGAIKMNGNPFFIQERPGKNERVFRLIKFRSMSNLKDENGILLPDNERMNRYGLFLRKTSLDELPELFNIFLGSMSVVGPRPLAVGYLKAYTLIEKHRHDVTPGLTGLAQINGRTAISWDQRFAFDLEYVNSISFWLDTSIVLKTIVKVFEKKDVVQSEGQIDFCLYRKQQKIVSGKRNEAK